MKAIINNINIAYDTAGQKNGIPVVFIHGFPFSKEMWKPQVDALKGSHFVVTYDVRGHGGTDVGDGQYSIEYFVDDLIGLLDHLKISKAVIVGLSMGGYIALRAIERHPEQFQALVLADTRSETDGNEAKVKRAIQAKAIKIDGAKKFAEGFVKAVFWEKSFQTKPEAVEMIRTTIEKTPPLGIAGTLIALASRTDTTSSLADIKIPTLILVGEHDAITPPSASQSMKEKIPNSELYVIPEAAHMSNLENTTEFNKHLINFLKKL